jgi:hypothetical protein
LKDGLRRGAESPTAQVRFQGTSSSGQIVTHTIQLDNRTGFQRFFMPSTFRHLSVLQWSQGDVVNNGVHMFDNLLLLPTGP